MEKKEINFEKIKFRCLKYEEIDECVDLISETFSLFDPFFIILNLNKNDLKKTIHEDLSKTISDNLITISLDEKNKIIGCYAGFKLSKKPHINLIKKKEDIIRIKSNKLELIEQKLEFLEFIDNNLIFNRYSLHSKNNELDSSIFCDYFCVSSDYFQTDLAKNLASKFFENCMMNGSNNIYGSFYNIKAVKLLTKNFDAQIGNILLINLKYFN